MINNLYQKYLDAHQQVTTDTRKIKQGDLFFALKGDNFNGNEYALKAIELGASWAIVDEIIEDHPQLIKVDNVLATLQNLARHHRLQFKIPFIGITGSNGKTSSKELIASVLSTTYKTYFTQGNLNNHIGVPLTILSIPMDCEMAIIEMGANGLHEIQFLCQISLPSHGVITNIGKAHIEGFGSFQGIIDTKSELYQSLIPNKGTIFINAQDDILKSVAPIECPQVKYNGGDFIIEEMITNPTLKISLKDLRLEKTVELQSQLFGRYNAINITLAYAVGRFFNVPTTSIQEAISNYRPNNNRSQIERSSLGNTIIWDAYNANPSSMEQAVNSFSEADMDNKIIILGDMKELGDTENQEHQDLIQKIAGFKGFLVGNIFNNNRSPFEMHSHFKNVDELGHYLKSNPIKNSTILIKGSRSVQLEKLKPFV